MTSSETLWDIAQRMCKEKEANQPVIQKHKTIIVLGSKNVGKTSVIHKLLEREGDEAKPTLALDYTFGRKFGKNQEKEVCHIWELGGGTLYTDLLSAPLASVASLSLTSVVLMLDLSSPKQLWFTLEKIIQALLSSIQEIAGNELTKLQDQAWTRIGKDHQDKDLIDPFPVPLVILGGKYDKFQEYEPEKKKIICRSLRYVAHTLGASLQFYSLYDIALVKKTKDMLRHLAFSSAPVKTISQDYNKPLIVPAGADSIEQIEGNLSTTKGQKASLERWKHIFCTHFPQEVTERTVMPDDPAKDENFREPIIDALRMQKDEELERWKKLHDVTC